MKTLAEIEAELDADLRAEFELIVPLELEEGDRQLLWQVFTAQKSEAEKMMDVEQLDDRLQPLAMRLLGYEVVE